MHCSFCLHRNIYLTHEWPWLMYTQLTIDDIKRSNTNQKYLFNVICYKKDLIIFILQHVSDFKTLSMKSKITKQQVATYPIFHPPLLLRLLTKIVFSHMSLPKMFQRTILVTETNIQWAKNLKKSASAIYWSHTTL